MKLTDSKVIKGVIYCKTGMHIGGSEENIEIGGIDNSIIKHPVTLEPFIPGSSLKGKMRSQMEKKTGKVKTEDEVQNPRDAGQPCGCARNDCYVCRVFGPHRKPNHKLGPTRILVRDAMLHEDSRQEMKEAVKEGKSWIEVKTENIIDRNTGTAKHPRSVERVPAGAKFSCEVVLQIFDMDDENELLGFIRETFKSVEESYLGGSGSRGYGNVKFVDLTIDDEPFNIN